MTWLRVFRPFLTRVSLLVAAGLLPLAGCGGSGAGGGSATRVTVSIGGGSAAKSGVLRGAARVPASVRSIRVSAQGPGMAEILETIAVDGEGPFSVTISVPSGPERTFLAEALDGEGAVRYLGSTTVDAFGDRLTVAIRLGFAPSNTALRNWRFLNPTPTARDLKGVAYGNGTFVAVGASGTLLTSADEGTTWTTRFVDTQEDLLGVAFGSGAFVVVGDAGGIFLSLDNGAAWARAASIEGGLAAVAFGGGRFLALGAGPAVLSSADGGRTWVSLVQEGLPSSAEPATATFGGGRFYALFDVFGEGSSTELYSSPDGVTWAFETRAALGSTGLAYGNGMVLVASLDGEMVVLSSGSDPVSYFLTDGTDLHGAAFGDNGFAAVGGSGFLAVSSDPTLFDTWTNASADTAEALRGCAVGGGTVVAVGDGGMVVTYDGEVTDVRWSTRPTGLPDPLTADVGPLGFGNGTLVAAAGSDAILNSSDGGATWSSWTRSPPQSTGGPVVGPLAGFAFGSSVFVAVGPLSVKVPFTAPATPTLYVSTDAGETWSDEAGEITEDLTGIAFGAGAFVATSANDGIYRCLPPVSPNSSWTWTRLHVPDQKEEGISLEAVAFGNGLFVAVGNAGFSGRVFTSADLGQTWSAIPGFSAPGLQQLVHGDRGFVAMDEGGNAYSSADGFAWAAAGTVPLNDSSVSGLAYGGGVLVVTDTRGFLYSSTDNAGTWSEIPFRSPFGLNSVTFGDGAFLAGGDRGTILQSEDL